MKPSKKITQISLNNQCNSSKRLLRHDIDLAIKDIDIIKQGYRNTGKKPPKQISDVETKLYDAYRIINQTITN